MPEVVPRRDLLRLLEFSALHDVWIESAWELLPSTSRPLLCERIPHIFWSKQWKQPQMAVFFLFFFHINQSCFTLLHRDELGSPTQQLLFVAAINLLARFPYFHPMKSAHFKQKPIHAWQSGERELGFPLKWHTAWLWGY